MASPCVVQFCRNIGNHRFPNNETRRAEWIRAIQHVKPGLTIRKNSFICSAHFRPTDFAITPSSFTNLNPPRVLKRNVIPSIFPWNQTSLQLNSATPHFDPSKVQNTYSRIPPTAFVEMPPLMDHTTDMQMDEIEDPLQLIDQTDIEVPLQPQSNQEMEINPTEGDFIESSLPPIYFEENENITNLIEIGTKSIQTQTQDDKIQIVTTSVQTQTHGENMTTRFSIYDYKNDEKCLHFYTGLENFKKYMLVFFSLGKSAQNLNYFYGPLPEKIDVLDQFFITLIILRRHKTFVEMSFLFKIAVKHVYNIFITWIRFMALQWRKLDLWVDRDSVRAYAPLDFYEKYPATRVILDATECPIQKPKLPLAQQVTFSTYKNRNTIKFIVGITPGGLISYVSPVYGGSATDRQIIERSSILDKFDFNDEIMVDKGLNVQDIFVSYGVKVNMPAFFKKGNQISPETLTSNRKVASKRVHVERVIGQMKTYKILIQPMNQTEVLLSSDIVLVIAMLVNFRSNIINKNA